MSPADVRGADRQFLRERDIAEQVPIVAAIVQVERPRGVPGPPAVGVEAIPRDAAGKAKQEREAHQAAGHGH